jgi:hypothetical protein
LSDNDSIITGYFRIDPESTSALGDELSRLQDFVAQVGSAQEAALTRLDPSKGAGSLQQLLTITGNLKQETDSYSLALGKMADAQGQATGRLMDKFSQTGNANQAVNAQLVFTEEKLGALEDKYGSLMAELQNVTTAGPVLNELNAMIAKSDELDKALVENADQIEKNAQELTQYAGSVQPLLDKLDALTSEYGNVDAALNQVTADWEKQKVAMARDEAATVARMRNQYQAGEAGGANFAPDAARSMDDMLAQMALLSEKDTAALNQLMASGERLEDALAKVGSTAQTAGQTTAEALKEPIAKTESLFMELEKAATGARDLAAAMESIKPPESVPEQGFVDRMANGEVDVAGRYRQAFGSKNWRTQAVVGRSDKNDLVDEMDWFGGEEGGPEPKRSMFGVGHALSVAGFTTNAPGLREAGAGVYMYQGLSQVATMMGTSMGAIAAAAVPAVAALALIGAEVNNLTEIVKKGAEAIKEGMSRLEEYYGMVTQSTPDLEKTRAQAEDKLKAEQQAMAPLKEKAAGSSRQFMQTMQGGVSIEAIAEYVGIRSLTDQLNETQKNADKAATALDNANNALNDSTRNASENARQMIVYANAQIEQAKRYEQDNQLSTQAARDKVAALQAEVAQQERAIDLIKQADASTNLSAEQKLADKEAIEKLDDARKNELHEITYLTDVSMSLIAAREAEAAAISATIKAIDDEIAERNRRADLEKNATVKQVQDLMFSNDTDLYSQTAARDKLQKKIDAESQAAFASGATSYTTPQAYVDELNKLNVAIDSDTEKAKYYHDVLMKLAEDHDAAAQAAKDHEQTLQDEAKAYETYQSKLKQIDDDYTQQRIKINQDFQDALIKATEDAGKAAEDAYRKKMDDQFKLSQQLGDDNAKAQRAASDKAQDILIKAQRDERDKLQEHLQRLQEIKDSDSLAEQKALLDRNYTQLLSISLSKTQAMQKEQEKYDAEREKRNQAANDQLGDLQRNLDREGRERAIAYQNKLRDEQQQYVREVTLAQQRYTEALQLAQTKTKQELDDLTAKYKQQQDLAEQNFKNEMYLARETAEERAQLLINEALLAQRLMNQLTGQMNAPAVGNSQAGYSGNVGSHSAVRTMAGGGFLNAGQSAIVQEPWSSGREAFNGVNFPNAMGLFTALQSGYVNPGGTSKPSQPLTFYINSTDVEGVRREVLDILEHQ